MNRIINRCWCQLNQQPKTISKNVALHRLFCRRNRLFSGENIDTLIGLGLNGSQARVYLALLTTGAASVKETSKASQLSRPDAYRALMRLEQLGLIERVIVTPAKYTPQPIFEALSILLGQKEKENIELHQKASKLYENCKQTSSPKLHDENYEFTQVPQGKALLLKQEKMVQQAQKTICLALSQKKLLLMLVNDESVEDAVARGVAVKVLTGKYEGQKMPKDVLELMKKENFQIRYTSSPLTECFGIFDGTQALLTTSSSIDYADSAAVWSNNPNFVELSQNYFDSAWFAASQLPEQFDYLFTKLIGSFSYNQIIFGSDGTPAGYVIHMANDSYLKMFNIDEESLGKKMPEPFPGAEADPALMHALLKVAGGKMAHFEYSLQHNNCQYSLSGYSQEKGFFVLIAKNALTRNDSTQLLSITPV